MADPIQLDEVGSTSDWVREHRAGLADGQWVIARRQTAGRGRMGRPWQDRPGNFMGSCRIVPEQGEFPLHLFSFVAALALHDAVSRHVPAEQLMLKWPNDLLLDGAKLSGILLESEAGEVVLGIGVNLAHAPDVPGRRTIALSDTGAAPPLPSIFAETLAAELALWRGIWRTEGFARVRQCWLDRAHPIGHGLAVSSGSGTVDGRFAGLADDGALLLDTEGGIRTFHAADVRTAGGTDAAGD